MSNKRKRDGDHASRLQEEDEDQDGVAPFISKLMAMVRDPTTDHLISWSPSGSTIIVHNSQELGKEVLPTYFKHSNFTSLVRQLNMYGFHKVVGVDEGALKASKKSQSKWEFVHPSVHRDKPHLLVNVKRKESAGKRRLDQKEVANAITDLEMLKTQNDVITEKFAALQRENAMLWTEVQFLRDRHSQTQRQLQAIAGFIKRLIPRQQGLQPSAARLMIEPSSNIQEILGDDDAHTVPGILPLEDGTSGADSVPSAPTRLMSIGANDHDAKDVITEGMDGVDHLFGAARQRLHDGGLNESTMAGLMNQSALPDWDDVLSTLPQDAIFEPLDMSPESSGEPFVELPSETSPKSN